MKHFITKIHIFLRNRWSKLHKIKVNYVVLQSQNFRKIISPPITKARKNHRKTQLHPTRGFKTLLSKAYSCRCLAQSAPRLFVRRFSLSPFPSFFLPICLLRARSRRLYLPHTSTRRRRGAAVVWMQRGTHNHIGILLGVCARLPLGGAVLCRQRATSIDRQRDYNTSFIRHNNFLPGAHCSLALACLT